jgi:DNA-binding transcriptional LysR family regulator
MLNDVTELRTFVRIVATGSLSAASREMGVALSVVSKRLATLERRTEARLVARNTRRLGLTDEGQGLKPHDDPAARRVRQSTPSATRRFRAPRHWPV